MSKIIGKERIALNKFLGREAAQVLLEGDIIVPDVKPDIARIIKADASAVFSRTEVQADKAAYWGRLDIRILYFDSDTIVHNLNISSPIEDFINIEGATKDSWVTLTSSIENFDHWVINDRKMGYRVVVELTAAAIERAQVEVVNSIEDLPPSQLKWVNLAAQRVADKRFDQFTIKDEFAIPPNKPNIREILQYSASIANKEIRLSTGRVGITGDLAVAVLYRGESDNLIEFEEFILPFNGAIDMSAAKDSHLAAVNLAIIDVALRPRPDGDGEDRVLSLEVSVGADITLSQVDNLEILDDAYCLNKQLDITKETVSLSQLVSRNRTQANVKEVVQLDEEAPGIMQILKVDGAVQIDDVRLIDDKVVVEGVISADILYVAVDDELPLFNYQAVLPYKQVIETKGATMDMDCSIEHSIDHVGFNLLGTNEVELRFLLGFLATVQRPVAAQLITDVSFEELSSEALDAMPSMAIVSVQKDDSLWSIAKRYNASLEELMQINEIDEPEDLVPGAKLLVVKTVSE